jgi:hypothetical protein
MTLSTDDGPAFIRLMKHYVLDYTNRNDQSQTVQIMEPDYELGMGDHRLRGRDSDYHDATAKQMTQFPNLCLTVHEIVTSGERLAMRFSEHGASRLHDGRRCAWGGIGLYAWNGSKLTRNLVEQDYFSRRRQLRTGLPLPVDHPALAPWNESAAPPDAGAEATVRAWLESGALANTPSVVLDDQWTGAAVTPLIDQEWIEINDLFSCGDAVAFHIAQHGRFLPDAELTGPAGAETYLHMAGLVRVESGSVASGRIIRNRLELARRLSAG